MKRFAMFTTVLALGVIFAGAAAAQTIQKPLDAMFEEKLIDRRIDASKYLNVGLLPKPCAL